MTTVLVSREEDEKKNQKLKKKSKAQKLKRFAKKRLRKFGKGGTKETKTSDDDFDSSDEEKKRFGPMEAPFMKQYEDKKHLEHILDEQHYWSEPEEKETFVINDVS